jgi:hypothetical protein
MMKSTASRIALTLSLAAAGPSGLAEAQAQRVIDASVDRSSGDKMRGPATVTVNKINVLRYDVGIGVNVTFTAGPDLSGLPFIPPVPAAGGEEVEKEGSSSINRLSAMKPNQDLMRLLARLAGSETTYATFRGRVLVATRLVGGAAASLSALLKVSDAILQAQGGEVTLIARAKELELAKAVGTPWPVGADLEQALLALNLIENELSKIPTPPTPPDSEAHAYIRARVPQLRTAFEALRDSGDMATKFRESQDELRRWQLIVSAVVDGGPETFTRVIHADCGFQFETTKESKYELVTRDRLVANAPEVKRELLTIVCTSPLSVSGGFGFSFVDEHTLALVSSKPESGNTAVAKFGSSARSTYRPLPVILLNTRVKDFDDVWSMHASAGAVVDISTGEAGTDVEFVIGPSVAMSRAFFITAGWHWGRVSKLAGGFAEGDPVPEGVTAPPLEKSWSRSFALLATWKLR